MDYSSIVKSSRIRVARNIQNMSFVQNASAEDCLNLVSKAVDVLGRLGRYKIYHMGSLEKTDAEIMLGKHLVSKELVNNIESGCVAINSDETISIMLNEEDHIREQCILQGFQLEKAYRLLNDIDDELSNTLDFAFSEKYGYLTSCLTNLGTGMRASVMLFLPALTISLKMDKVISKLKERGLTVRGELGEGSAPIGYFYQVSNGVSMGLSEREILSMVSSAVKELCEQEVEERKRIYNEEKDMIYDLVLRSWGVLTSCYSIEWIEFMKLMGELKLGLSLNIIKLKDNSYADKIIEYCTDSGIQKLVGKPLDEKQIAQERAKYIGTILQKMRVK